MQALVLAGGAGTRLRPLTETVAKPILPLAGRPHIAYVIDWLVAHGVDDVVVSCGHLAGSVRDALGELEHVPIRYAVEPDARGTAGAIRFAEEHLGDRFLVLNGDILCDLDLSALVAQHERTGARATIALHPVADPSGYGLVRHTDGEIAEFLEKPDPSEIDTDEINAGAYVLERSILDLIPADREVSIEREVFPKLVGEGLYGRRLEGYWIDIGTPDRFLQANWDILEGKVATVVADHLDADSVFIGDDVERAATAEIAGPAVIRRGADLQPGAKIGPRAVVGENSHIGEDASVTESVLLPGCRVDRGATVSGAILSAGVEVAAGAAPEPGTVAGEGEMIAA
jgi:mannose-1-phosphate guanylyltransferase